MLRYTLLFIYVAVNILLFLLNWDLFTTTWEFNFGFGVFNTLPFLILQIFGAIIIGILILLNGMRNLLKEISIAELRKRNSKLKKDAEIAKLKQQIKTSTEDIIPQT